MDDAQEQEQGGGLMVMTPMVVMMVMALMVLIDADDHKSGHDESDVLRRNVVIATTKSLTEANSCLEPSAVVLLLPLSYLVLPGIASCTQTRRKP